MLQLPWDVKQECLWIVRGYERRVAMYRQMRQDVLDSSGEKYVTYEVDNEERRAYLPRTHAAGRTVEQKEVQLSAIEELPEIRKMRAVEYARANIGGDIQSENLRARLQQAMLFNCQNRDKYPFHRLSLPELSQRDFYRRKDRFLADIADFLHMI